MKRPLGRSGAKPDAPRTRLWSILTIVLVLPVTIAALAIALGLFGLLMWLF
jgi:hypothetical protein